MHEESSQNPKRNHTPWFLAIILLLVAMNIGLVFFVISTINDKPEQTEITSNVTEVTQVEKEETKDCSCDATRFKEEYETLNGKDNGHGGNHLEISIAKDNPMEYVDYTRIKQLLTNGTGVIYFGFPECPWCRNLIPTLIDTANEMNVKNILYFNNKAERDIKSLDESGNIITKTEGSDDYYELLELMEGHTSVYDGLNDESIKRLYFPTVVFVKDGEIVGFHEGTVDSQEDASVYVDAEQQKELKKILKENFEKLYPQACSTSGHTEC